MPYITIISNNDSLFTLNRNANLAIPILFFNKYLNLKTGRFETRRFETWHFVNMTFCKPDVLKPDFLKPDVLKPDVLKPDVLWVYRHYNVVNQSKQVILLFKKKLCFWNFFTESWSHPQVMLQPCLQAKWLLCCILYFRGFFAIYHHNK